MEGASEPYSMFLSVFMDSETLRKGLLDASGSSSAMSLGYAGAEQGEMVHGMDCQVVIWIRSWISKDLRRETQFNAR
jgi:hypothetical protein